MEGGKFRVSKVTSKDIMRTFVLDFCQKMSWIPGTLDDELYWAAAGPGSPEGAGIYIGTLGDTNTTCVGVIQHNEQYMYLCLYYCREEHRGKGYGLKTWRVALAGVGPQVNLCLDAVMSAAHLYEREGFKKFWSYFSFNFSVSAILKAYSSIPAPDGVSITPATEVDFDKLKLYVEDVIGFKFSRSDLLEKWITLPTHTALAAVTGDGDIVGFAAIRELIKVKEDGYRLAPLLADSGAIARQLLLKLALTVDPARRFAVYFLSGINTEAMVIADEVGGERGMEVVRMYTGNEPPLMKEKYFGLFSPELAG